MRALNVVSTLLVLSLPACTAPNPDYVETRIPPPVTVDSSLVFPEDDLVVVSVDMAAAPDLSVPDLLELDMSVVRDLTVPDLTPPPDLAIVDLRRNGDAPAYCSWGKCQTEAVHNGVWGCWCVPGIWEWDAGVNAVCYCDFTKGLDWKPCACRCSWTDVDLYAVDCSVPP